MATHVPKPRKPREIWVYGKHKNPRTWHETADILRHPYKPKGNTLTKLLKTIEEKLKIEK